LDVKSLGSTKEVHSKLTSLKMVEEGGIPGGEVKFVEIWRNIGGEGDLLGHS
jgi:hypothetical protein